MAAAWFALIGTLAGVAVTFLGNALLQNEQRTAVRRDAAADREAANLRDLQEAVSDFALVWGPIVAKVLQGDAPFDPMDPANADGRPGETYGRVLFLAHRAQNQTIRDEAHDWIGHQFLFAKMAAWLRSRILRNSELLSTPRWLIAFGIWRHHLRRSSLAWQRGLGTSA